MQNGFIKVAAAVPRLQVADCRYNIEQMEALMVRADSLGVEIVCFPELGLTGYTCQDLFAQQTLLEESEAALLRLMEFSRNVDVISIVGLPVVYDGMLFNCGAVLRHGKVWGFVPKTFLPNYKEFYEKRWFTPAPALPADAWCSFAGKTYRSVRASSSLMQA